MGPTEGGNSYGTKTGYLVWGYDGVFLIVEPPDYSLVMDLANGGRLQVRISRFEGKEVGMLGEPPAPKNALVLQMLGSHTFPQPSRRLVPLRVRIYANGGYTQRALGLLEPFEGEDAWRSAPVQRGLSLVSPIEEAWQTANARYHVVGAPF